MTDFKFKVWEKIKNYVSGDFTDIEKRDNSILINSLSVISWFHGGDKTVGDNADDMVATEALKSIAENELTRLERRIIDAIANAVYGGSILEEVTTDVRCSRYEGVKQAATRYLEYISKAV